MPYDLCQWLLVNRAGPSTEALVRLVSDDWRPWNDVWLVWLKYAVTHNETFASEVGNLPEELEQAGRVEEEAVAANATVEALISNDPFLSQLIAEL